MSFVVVFFVSLGSDLVRKFSKWIYIVIVWERKPELMDETNASNSINIFSFRRKASI